MSYIDSRQPLMPQHHQYIPGSDVIGIRPQVQANGNEHSDTSSEYDQQHPPLKRPRIFDDASSNNINGQCVSSRVPISHSVPVNRGTANIFFKTRFCAKFKAGACKNGENCNFAHGMQDLRQPPPNWQEIAGASVCSEEDRPIGNWEDDQRIIHKMKLCKKFINGEECPYGDRCSFLHEFPSKFREYRENSREEMVRYRDNSRENSAISIGTSGPPMGHGNNGSFVVAGDVNRSGINSGFDAARANVKPVYWKTKLCTKFEITGHCPFGDKCHFAHGLAELQVSSGEVGNAGSVLTKQPSSLPGNTSPRKSMNVYSSTEEGLGKRCFLKLKDHKKLNTIYADWPDDLPFMHNSSNHVES